jgi:hypothetical protein
MRVCFVYFVFEFIYLSVVFSYSAWAARVMTLSSGLGWTEIDWLGNKKLVRELGLTPQRSSSSEVGLYIYIGSLNIGCEWLKSSGSSSIRGLC